MFTRWNWLLKNKETYVNMLRCCNYNDEQIQACVDGRRPLSFKNQQVHKEFCHELINLKKEI